MGDPKKLRKLYEKPMRLWDKERLSKEKALVEEFSLKNMRELWKAKTILRKIRREVRRLLSNKGTGIENRKEQVLGRVKRLLLKKQAVSLDDVLSLEERDILSRRLQTVVYKKHMATTMTQARQFITHGHVAVDNTRITAPSYLVRFEEEDKIAWFGSPIVVDKNQTPAASEAPAEKAVVEAALAESKN